jgi:choline dehydrogenase
VPSNPCSQATHFTPPNEDLAAAFNITWDPTVWGSDPKTRIYASFPNYQSPNKIPMYRVMAKMPKVEIPLDGAGGRSGLYWFPSSLDPKTYYRSYSRTGHYDPIKERPNFEVVTMSKVKRILFEGTTAAGVQYASRSAPDVLMRVAARKEVIISAGTVHTPQILQNSGIGPRNLLAQANIPLLLNIPGVGQNFQDHAYLSVGYQWANGAPPEPTINVTGGNVSSVSSPNLGAWIPLSTVSTDKWQSIATEYENQDPAAYLPKDSHPYVVSGYKKFQALHTKLLRGRDTNILWLPIGGGAGGIVMSMHIVSHGTININTTHPDEEPIVDYRALSNPIDLKIMAENINFMRKFMNHPDFAAYGPTESSPGANITGLALEEWIRQQIIPTNFHPIATAAKKPLEDGGVVNEELFVHGTKKLRIVDASVMPLLPGANTQQPTYMLAEKVRRLQCLFQNRSSPCVLCAVRADRPFQAVDLIKKAQ